MQKKKSVVFYESYFRAIMQISDPTSRERLYTALFTYAFDGKEPDFSELSNTEYMFLELALPTVEASIQNYLNGCKGGAPLGNQNAKKTTGVVLEKTTGGIENKTTNKDKDKDLNKDLNKDYNKDTIIIPTITEIREYCDENKLTKVNPTEFYNYYKIRGWNVKNWMDAVTAWNKNSYSKKSKTSKNDYYAALKGPDWVEPVYDNPDDPYAALRGADND